MSYPFIIKDSFISVFIDGVPQNIDRTHPNFDRIREAIKAQDWETVRTSVDIPKTIVSQSSGKVTIRDGNVYYHDMVLHGSITKRIIQMIGEGFNVSHMLLFIENLVQNPAKQAQDELYDFLDAGNCPITDDGHFLAYKKVRGDYTDCYSGKFDNSIGTVVEMDRDSCDPNRNQTCSTGLHFCSFDYLSQFGGERVMIVKVNPKDVTSIPSDYDNAKGRCCRYEVIGEYDGYKDTPTKEYFDKAVAVQPKVELTPNCRDVWPFPKPMKSLYELALEAAEEPGGLSDSVVLSAMALSDLTIAQLTNIYNILTCSCLKRFKDKRTAVRRILENCD